MTETSIFMALYEERKQLEDGSGGSPKIELPYSGPNRSLKSLSFRAKSKHDSMRSMASRNLSGTADRINVMAKVSYNKLSHGSKKSLTAAINYNLDRERGKNEKERSIFSSKELGIGRHSAGETIERNFGEHIAYHKIILSSGDNDISQVQFTRSVMTEWQNTIGREFDYYAVEHQNTDHHHVHIIIPGRSYDERDLRFDRAEIAILREIGDNYLARDRAIDRQFDRQIAIELGFDLQKQLDKEVQELFHMSSKDYQRGQEELGLQSYREMIKDQRELGILFQYNSDQHPNEQARNAHDQTSLEPFKDQELPLEEYAAFPEELVAKTLYESQNSVQSDTSERRVAEDYEPQHSRKRDDDDDEDSN